ncbi:hypothetical protein [Streptomyces sp. S.PB5]|uniref:MmyB family transcriptional regulator n=1 Tax=Streptomyces sp. S.PB5 TaxID=3020844 RepID=UPI0025AF6DEA|nr:hypothetical protein [Streptomyces sp. S.PB5]MDN3027054.1 hypothetical protein [Streptomyces sp. S.PB5]
MNDRDRSTVPVPEVTQPVVRLIEAWEDTPALVLGSCLDILAANALGRALYQLALPYGNLVRFTFVDPAARVFYRDWQDIAEAGVAWLRSTGGSRARDARLTEIVDELASHEEFQRLWGRYEVHGKASDVKRLHHPVVGDLTLRYQIFDVGQAVGQYLFTYQPDPASPGEKALAELRAVAAAQA